MKPRVVVQLSITELTSAKDACRLAREQKPLASELHDGALQDVLAARLGIDEVLSDGELPEVVRDRLARIAEQLDGTSARIRSLIWELFNGGDREVNQLIDGLRAEMGRWSGACGIAADLHARTGTATPTEAARSLMQRAVREGLANAFRHADASQVRVTVRHDRDQWRVMVDDDGIGYPVALPRPRVSWRHFGLGSLADEAKRLGGGLRLGQSETLGGCQLSLSIPAGQAGGAHDDR